MWRAPRVDRVLACLALLAPVALGGCSADASSPGPGGASPVSAHATPSRDSDDPGIALRSRVTRVAGSLSDVRRSRVNRTAGTVLAAYLDDAFSGDPHVVREAFEAFTPRLRRSAAADRPVLSGSALASADRVEGESARASLAVLAPKGRPAGLTAHLEIHVRVNDGDHSRSVTLRGRVLMTPSKSGWRIFGYDVARSGVGR